MTSAPDFMPEFHANLMAARAQGGFPPVPAPGAMNCRPKPFGGAGDPEGHRRKVDVDIAEAKERGDIDAELMARFHKFNHLMREHRGHGHGHGHGPKGCGASMPPAPGAPAPGAMNGAGLPPFAGKPGVPGAPAVAPAIKTPFGNAAPMPPMPPMPGAPAPGAPMPPFGGPCGNPMEQGHMGRGRVLVTLALQDGMTQKDLAFILGIRPQSLSELLAKLEADGLIERTRSEADKRATLVTLTEAGREKAAHVQEKRNATAQTLLAKLTADEKVQLAALLAKMED